MNIVYLLLGSNLNDPDKQLSKATTFIKKEIGAISRRSSKYQTAAWGNIYQPDFLNQVIKIRSEYSATEILDRTLSIEHKMGRIRTEKNAPRSIDIDILFFNKEIIHTNNLTVPHIAMQDRRFVLVPLNELSPQFLHPVLHQTIHQLLLHCSDALPVKKISSY